MSFTLDKRRVAPEQSRLEVWNLTGGRVKTVNLPQSASTIIQDRVYTGLSLSINNFPVTGTRYDVANIWEANVTNILSLVVDITFENEFRIYADKWYEELNADAESSLTKITSSINYLQVLALSPKRKVISLILEELKVTSAPWFLALQILTGNSEVGATNPQPFL